MKKTIRKILETKLMPCCNTCRDEKCVGMAYIIDKIVEDLKQIGVEDTQQKGEI